MAAGSSGSWSMMCNICNQSIQVFGGDFQASLELHSLKMHKNAGNMPQTNQRSNNRENQHVGKRNMAKYAENNSNNSFTCPVCNDRVEIFNGNFNQCIQAHFTTHNQSTSNPRPNEQLYTFDGIRNWIENSELLERKSNHSKDNPRSQNFQKNTFSGLPMGLKQHRGFLTENKDNAFCNICAILLESTNSVHEHLKTKTHEDNVILCLKQKFAPHIQNMMEFVSFYGSNLCCNLCRCKIDLNSYNVHETIVNIVSHNADIGHSSKRSQNDTRVSSSQSDIAFTLLQSLANKHQQINQNKHLIKTAVEPQFKCRWCDKSIAYHEKDHVLAQNFITHLNSSVHKKSQNAFNVLKAFQLMNVNQGYHRYVMANGSITCVPCKTKVEAEINKLLLHITEAGHSQQEGSQHSSGSCKSTSNFTKNQPNSAKGTRMKNWMSSESISSNNEKPKSNPGKPNKSALKVNFHALLRPLEQDFGKLKFIIQKDQSQVTCLICNQDIPSTTHNIRSHLTGNPHRKKIESQLQETAQSISNQNEDSPIITIEKQFQLLPHIFQEDRQFIRDSPIDGYFTCSLCNAVINPHYLREHLLDKKHILEKQGRCGLLQI